MEKIAAYRQLIKKILTADAALANRGSQPGAETFCVFDETSDHYILASTGWVGKHRLRGNTVHVRLKEGKIWIEDDMTERGIATDLVEAGVPKEDIVLGFQHPSRRPMTEFAVA